MPSQIAHGNERHILHLYIISVILLVLGNKTTRKVEEDLPKMSDVEEKITLALLFYLELPELYRLKAVIRDRVFLRATLSSAVVLTARLPLQLRRLYSKQSIPTTVLLV